MLTFSPFLYIHKHAMVECMESHLFVFLYTHKLIQCVARWFSLIISVEKLKLYSNCDLSNLFFLTNNNRIPFLCLVIQLQPVKQLRGRRWVSGVQPGQLHFLSRVLCHFRHDQLNMWPWIGGLRVRTLRGHLSRHEIRIKVKFYLIN